MTVTTYVFTSDTVVGLPEIIPDEMFKVNPDGKAGVTLYNPAPLTGLNGAMFLPMPNEYDCSGVTVMLKVAVALAPFLSVPVIVYTMVD